MITWENTLIMSSYSYTQSEGLYVKISENDHLSELLWAFIKFSQLILQGMYCGQSGEFVCGY